jgi:hypothetical protein
MSRSVHGWSSRTESLVLCFFSPLNVDRLVSLFRAAKRSERTFVYDLLRRLGRARDGPQDDPASGMARGARLSDEQRAAQGH